MRLLRGLALALTILFFFAVPVAGKLAASRDFVSYWATGQQLVRHANPYDRDAVAALEHSAGLTVKAVLIMRNPPWALPLAYPLGFLPLRLAGILWSLLLLACLLISVRMVRELHGSPPNRIHWLGFAFTPALICLTMGQTALFALLGLVLFLRLHQSGALSQPEPRFGSAPSSRTCFFPLPPHWWHGSSSRALTSCWPALPPPSPSPARPLS